MRTKRGKYILHKENPTSFKKGIIPWNKGKGEPQEGDKECPICHKIFHYVRKGNNIAPLTCSKECRYKSTAIKQKGMIYSLTIPYSRNEKRKAQAMVQKLVKNGAIKKELCKICNTKAQAHHYKGYKPENWLDIKWLCDFHHHEEHKRLRVTGESLLL